MYPRTQAFHHSFFHSSREGLGTRLRRNHDPATNISLPSEGNGASFPTSRDRDDDEWNTVPVGSGGSRNRDPEPRTSELDRDGLTSGDDSEVEIFANRELAETQPLTQTTEV